MNARMKDMQTFTRWLHKSDTPFNGRVCLLFCAPDQKGSLIR